MTIVIAPRPPTPERHYDALRTKIYMLLTPKAFGVIEAYFLINIFLIKKKLVIRSL